MSRALDIVLAAMILTCLWPLAVAAALLLAVRTAVVERTPRIGRGGRPFNEFRVVLRGKAADRPWRRLRFDRLPVLLNILRGEMAFVGPRAVSPGDPLLNEAEAPFRFHARPGLVCLWWVRRRANIDYGREAAADFEYIATRGIKRDLGILARALFTLPFGPPPQAGAAEVSILGLRIDSLTMDEAVAQIVGRARGGPPTQVCFVNADCANIAFHDAEYRRVVQTAPLVLADGIGIKLAGRILGQQIRQNICGTDLFPRLCESIAGTDIGLFLLGARPGVADAVRQWVRESYPQARVAGCRHGYFSPQDEPEVLREIADSGAEILLVAFGAPRQDVWIGRCLAATGAQVAIGVGGLFDFYSGRVPRAPLWMRELGLEWLFRFWQEPRRMWRRYFLGNPLFLLRVLRERVYGPPAWATPRCTTAAREADLASRPS